MEVKEIQHCSFACGNVAQAVVVQLVRDAPDTKKVIPYCGDHLDVFCICLVREQLKTIEEESGLRDDHVLRVLDALDARARELAQSRAEVHHA